MGVGGTPATVAASLSTTRSIWHAPAARRAVGLRGGGGRRAVRGSVRPALTAGGRCGDRHGSRVNARAHNSTCGAPTGSALSGSRSRHRTIRCSIRRATCNTCVRRLMSTPPSPALGFLPDGALARDDPAGRHAPRQLADVNALRSASAMVKLGFTIPGAVRASPQIVRFPSAIALTPHAPQACAARRRRRRAVPGRPADMATITGDTTLAWAAAAAHHPMR